MLFVCLRCTGGPTCQPHSPTTCTHIGARASRAREKRASPSFPPDLAQGRFGFCAAQAPTKSRWTNKWFVSLEPGSAPRPGKQTRPSSASLPPFSSLHSNSYLPWRPRLFPSLPDGILHGYMGEGIEQPIWERWLAAEARARWWLTRATWRGCGFRRWKRSPPLTKCEVNDGDSSVPADVLVSTIIRPSHHKYTPFLLRTVSGESGALLCFSHMASHMRFGGRIAHHWFGKEYRC
jgi:hypothetical protein